MYRLRSKNIPAKIRLIRKLNKQLGLSIPETTIISTSKGASKSSEGWKFDFYFYYEGKGYGATVSITKCLKFKKLSLDKTYRDIEIVELTPTPKD